MLLSMSFNYTLLHLLLHFAAFYLSFCCKTHCVLVHITLRFGAYCTAFCGKTQCNN